MDHKPLIPIFKKDVATLSQQIQYILLRIHQYWVRILYKLGLEIFIADWLSQHNHMENKDEAIQGMDVKVDAVQTSTNVPECMSIQKMQCTTAQDEHLQWLKGYINAGWPESKDHLHQDIRASWPFKDDMAVINGVILRGRHIIIPETLKAQALEQLHINHMGIEKNKNPRM